MVPAPPWLLPTVLSMLAASFCPSLTLPGLRQQGCCYSHMDEESGQTDMPYSSALPARKAGASCRPEQTKKQHAGVLEVGWMLDEWCWSSFFQHPMGKEI